MTDQREEFEDAADAYYEAELASVRRANASFVEQLKTAREATALLDRLQEQRIFVLPGADQAVICGGRQDGWLCWRHPDGQWVTLEKLRIERPTSPLKNKVPF